MELVKAPTTYEVGTIIKYKVNDLEERYFYVLEDNGNTLTLQQRENTTRVTKWYDGGHDNTKGPITILSALEAATSSWSNVLDQTYELGTTIFKDNAYTGCSSYNLCTANTYILPKRTAKARMITIQEATRLGCTTAHESCPIWMKNILGDGALGYWMSSAYSNNATDAWAVDIRYGYLAYGGTSLISNGVRAIVNIEK